MNRLIKLTYSSIKEKINDILFVETEVLKVHKDLYDSKAWTEKEFLYQLPRKDEISLAVEKKEKIIGFSIGYEFDLKYAHISRVAVLPTWKGKGIGRKLFLNQLSILEMLGYKRCSIDLVSKNKGALNFYQKFGFIQIQGENLKEYIKLKNRDIGEYIGQKATHIAMIKEF